MAFKRYFIIAMMALSVASAAFAAPAGDEEDYDVSIRKGIRRLHPERERAKAIKKLQQQRAQKAVPKVDPWDTSDEAWGTVEVVPEPTSQESIADEPVATSPSGEKRKVTTAQGRRLNATTKSASDQEQLDALLGTDYSLQQYEVPGTRRMTWRDEPVKATRESLQPYFELTGSSCLPRGLKLDNGTNAVFFYFNVVNGEAQDLRLRVQYCADDPINFEELVFSVDGFDYTFFPQQMQRGNDGDGYYWQTSDDELRRADRDLVYALSHSHWAMLKLKGADGVSHVKMLSDVQRDDFARTFQFFRLLGGSL